MTERDTLIKSAISAWREGEQVRWKFAEIAKVVVGKYQDGATRDIADQIGRSVDTVQDYAKAGVVWDGLVAWHEQYEYPWDRLMNAREKLPISHFIVFADASKQTMFDWGTGADLLFDVAEADKIITVEAFSNLLDGKFTEDGGDPEWLKRWEYARRYLRKAINDYGIPEYLRDGIRNLLSQNGDYIRSYKYTIENYRPPSWNKFMRAHWSKQHDWVQYVSTLVREQIDPKDTTAIPTRYPVDIQVICHFKDHTQDSDNPPAKLFIDGLKPYVIPDDTIKFVNRVTTQAVKGTADMVDIIVTEVPA